MSERLRELLGYLRSELEEEGLQEFAPELERNFSRLIEANEEALSEAEGRTEESLLEREREMLEEVWYTVKGVRAAKILERAVEGRGSAELGGLEKELWDLVEEYFERRPTKEKEEDKKLASVLADVPAFIGADGEEYGPFEEGDVVLINEEDYEALRGEELIEEARLDK